MSKDEELQHFYDSIEPLPEDEKGIARKAIVKWSKASRDMNLKEISTVSERIERTPFWRNYWKFMTQKPAQEQ